jgi:hypothetical protein
MKTSDVASANLNTAESGKVWEEKLTGAQGSIEVVQYTTFRVRATGATTVTIDGILAMTMASGEIAIFSAGRGDQDDAKPTITITIAGANAFVQVARNVDRPKLAS